MSNPTQVLNDLPCLALEKIFRFLDVCERIRMMSVCKKWKWLIENGEKNLCIHHQSLYPANRFWVYPNRKKICDLDKVKIRYRRAFQCPTVDSLYEIEFHKFSFLKNIKKLEFYSPSGNHCDLVITDRFHTWFKSLYQLTELAFCEVCLKFKKKLEHENLKALTLGKAIYFEGKFFPSPLVLNTPKLEILYLHNRNLPQHSIILLYPEAVKTIDCFLFDETFEKCSNLEKLSFEKIEKPSDLLRSHPKLKRIEALPWDGVDVQGLEVLRSQKLALKKSSLEFIVSGSLHESVFWFLRPKNRYYDQPFEIDETNLNQFVKHCGKMNHPVQIALAISNFQKTIAAFGGRLPANFATLFPEIRELVACQKVDSQLLFDFLRGCKALEKIELELCQLGSEFYGRLHHLRSTLESVQDFKIFEKDIKINFQFLFLMENLEAFRLELAEQKYNRKLDLLISIERDDLAPSGTNVYTLFIAKDRTDLNDFGEVYLKNLVALLCQNEEVQKILC